MSTNCIQSHGDNPVLLTLEMRNLCVTLVTKCHQHIQNGHDL